MAAAALQQVADLVRDGARQDWRHRDAMPLRLARDALIEDPRRADAGRRRYGGAENRLAAIAERAGCVRQQRQSHDVDVTILLWGIVDPAHGDAGLTKRGRDLRLRVTHDGGRSVGGVGEMNDDGEREQCVHRSIL